MKPLAEIVAELERRIGGTRTRSMEKTVSVNEIELCRLLAAFRAGEEMRAAILKVKDLLEEKDPNDAWGINTTVQYFVGDGERAFDAAVRGDGE